MRSIYSSHESGGRTLKYLDYYLSDELSIEVALEVSRHLETCAVCADELKVRTRLRNRLRKAVRQTPAAPGFLEKVTKRIRQDKRQDFRFLVG
jgi:anti-sigma factor RsiW